MSQSDFVFHYSGWFWWVQQFLLCSPAVLECGRWNDVQPTVRHTWIHSTHQPLHMNQRQTSLQLLGTSVLLGRTTSLQFLQGLVSSRFLGNCFCSNGFSASCCHIKCSLMFELALWNNLAFQNKIFCPISKAVEIHWLTGNILSDKVTVECIYLQSGEKKCQFQILFKIYRKHERPVWSFVVLRAH